MLLPFTRYKYNNIRYKNNQIKKPINFKGIKSVKVNFPSVIKSISETKLDNIYNTLSQKVSNFAPDFITENGSEISFKKATPLYDTLTFPFFKLPKQLLYTFANKFNITPLKKSDFLLQFEQEKEREMQQIALRGILKGGDEFIEKTIQEITNNKTYINKDIIKDLYKNNSKNNKCKLIEKKVTDKFYQLFDENLAPQKARYHTAHERAIARLASGSTAAIMLGSDFYNKSLLNGKSEQEAKIELKSKRKQELVATGMEAMAQYLMLGAFSDFTNNSKWGAPILNTLLGIFFHITSRISTKRPLKRLKIPKKIEYTVPSLNDYRIMVKTKDTKYSSFTQKTTNQTNICKNKQKHLLSFKNIGLFCLTSIGIGFSLRGIKSIKTINLSLEKIYNLFNINKIKEKLYKTTVCEVWISQKELNDFKEVLQKTSQEGLLKYINNTISFDKAYKKQFQEHGKKVDKILIGTYEKMIKIPIIGEASKKELLNIPLTPFKIFLELFAYPYKAMLKILEGLKIIKEPTKFKFENKYNILNTYRKYQLELSKSNGVIDANFISNFKEILEKNRLSALNKETKSSVNNAAIGKTTQLLGTFSSIYFATTDDYNATIKQTGDINKAQKDARLRGVNKIIRIATQIVFMNINNILKIPYATSVMGAGLITVACTIATDSVSRILSGMPFIRMNKEQLEQYNIRKKEGILKNYYALLDKLTD